jgi:hypothetical protein
LRWPALQPGGNVTSDRSYDRNTAFYEVGCECRQLLIFAKRPSIFDNYIRSFDETQLAQTFMEGG